MCVVKSAFVCVYGGAGKSCVAKPKVSMKMLRQHKTDRDECMQKRKPVSEVIVIQYFLSAATAPIIRLQSGVNKNSKSHFYYANIGNINCNSFKSEKLFNKCEFVQKGFELYRALL